MKKMEGREGEDGKKIKKEKAPFLLPRRSTGSPGSLCFIRCGVNVLIHIKELAACTRSEICRNTISCDICKDKTYLLANPLRLREIMTIF